TLRGGWCVRHGVKSVRSRSGTRRRAWRRKAHGKTARRPSRAGNSTLGRIAGAHGCSPAAVALAWTMRSGRAISIPESGSLAHVKENAAALSLALTAPDLQALDVAFPPPGR